MEVKTIAYNKKITAQLTINIQIMKYERHERYDRFVQSFVIDGLDGNDYSGSIDVIQETNKTNLNFYMFNVKSLETEADIVGSNNSNTVFQVKRRLGNAIKSGYYQNALLCSLENIGKISALFGKIMIEFEPTKEILMQENLAKCFSLFKGFEKTTPKDYDFSLKNQNQEFWFSKTCLSKISEVFKDMFENSSSNRSLELADTDPKTLATFKKIMDTASIKEEDITMELCIFGDKYDIQPLVTFCTSYFGNSLNQNNILEVIKIARLVQDDELLKKAALFCHFNRLECKENSELKDYLKNNPDCASKMFELSVF